MGYSSPMFDNNILFIIIVCVLPIHPPPISSNFLDDFSIFIQFACQITPYLNPSLSFPQQQQY